MADNDGFFKRLINFARPTRVAPTKTAGTHGSVLYGGYLASEETETDLSSRENRYKTYSQMLVNISIVGAGVRYFLNLVAKADWTFTPSEADTTGEYAEKLEEILTQDPKTPWHRIVRRAAMYRFYGFSVQEWTAKRREDGVITFKDVAPRAQRTISRWDVQDDGEVIGIIQTSPQTQKEIYLPRGKVMYLVDDTLSDSPEGLGLFRHLAKVSEELTRFEQLEGIGFDTDLRGVPLLRAPLNEINMALKAGTITKTEADNQLKAVNEFLDKHIKNPKLGLLIDSEAYTTTDDARRPSSASKWDMEILSAGGTSQEQLAKSIARKNREAARLLGVEQILLGEGEAGSYALSEDKTNSFFLLVDGSLKEIGEQVSDDLIDTIWTLNGWPEEMKPTVEHEAIRHQDILEVTTALKDLAQAGAVMAANDPAINEVRSQVGLSPAEEDAGMDDVDLSLTPRKPKQDPQPDDIEEDDDE